VPEFIDGVEYDSTALGIRLEFLKRPISEIMLDPRIGWPAIQGAGPVAAEVRESRKSDMSDAFGRDLGGSSG
jgi:hypothetical protein